MKLHNFIKRTTAVFAAALLTVSALHTPVFAAEDTTSYTFSDINVKVDVPSELVGFTRLVTSNNSYLDLIGADDVEELRSLMKINNIYLEAIPKDVSYELIVSGKPAGNNPTSYKEYSSEDLNELFAAYLKASDKIENSSVTEQVTNSYIETVNGQPYFVTDVTSVSNNYVTVYVRRYYTVIMGNAITFSIQSNGAALTADMEQTLKNVVTSAAYAKYKKPLLENEFFTEILSTVITLAVPIAILALILFIHDRSVKKAKERKRNNGM